MASAVIPAKFTWRTDFASIGLLSRGDGMIDMALNYAHRVGSGLLAVGTVASGVVAQVAPDTSVGQIGAVGTTSGLVILLIMLVREAAPTFLKWEEIRAANRNEKVRMEEVIRQRDAQREADTARIASLEVKLAETDARARRAENEVENAKIAADARAAAIEAKAREAGHLARNNSQRIQNVEEALASGSGDRDPEIAV